MGFININRFIRTPADIFDLQGCCAPLKLEQSIPCRIKVGPRRFLQANVRPEELKLTLWYRGTGSLTYLPGEPVETSTDKDGVLTVDMTAVAKRFFGADQISFCTPDDWRRRKDDFRSETFLATEQGVAVCRSTWLDINVTTSSLYFTPGSLTLCGHDVQRISWESFCEDMGADSQALRPLVETLLASPHILSSGEFLNSLNTPDLLSTCSFNHLTLCTDRGTYRMDSGVYGTVSVVLHGEAHTDYRLQSGLDTMKRIELLLQLMQAETREDLETTLEYLCRQRLLCSIK